MLSMWPPKTVHPFLRRLRLAAAADRVVLTVKATDEIRDQGWDHEWALELVGTLEPNDFERCENSTVLPGDVIWVFCPEIDDGTVWIRLTERDGMLVISFHLAGEP